MPALLNEASFFGLSGLEAALQVIMMQHNNATYQINQAPVPPFIVLQEHAKAEEERVAREQKDPRIGDEFLLNVGGEVTLLGYTGVCGCLVIFEVIDIFIFARYL